MPSLSLREPTNAPSVLIAVLAMTFAVLWIASLATGLIGVNGVLAVVSKFVRRHALFSPSTPAMDPHVLQPFNMIPATRIALWIVSLMNGVVGRFVLPVSHVVVMMLIPYVVVRSWFNLLRVDVTAQTTWLIIILVALLLVMKTVSWIIGLTGVFAKVVAVMDSKNALVRSPTMSMVKVWPAPSSRIPNTATPSVITA
jgi:hypothetical protein